MLDALVSAVWRGEFVRQGNPVVFILLRPQGLRGLGDVTKEQAGEYVHGYRPDRKPLLIKTAADMESDSDNRVFEHPTDEWQEYGIDPRIVAKLIGGRPGWLPYRWDGTDRGLRGYGQIPYGDWPSIMTKAQFEKWRLRRPDFSEWYATSSIGPRPHVNDWWVARVDAPLDGARAQMTGLPGRPPKSWALIEPEFRRRFASLDREKSAPEWAAEMRQWLVDQHPSAALPTKKTIANKLRPIIRKLRSQGR
jgi:hypothetical protein